MNLTATPLIHQDSPYVCPLLLFFKCILVRDEDIGFTKKTMFLGDIYAKMIRCLYKAFTLRKGIPYQATDFFDMLLKIGKLAFETLISGNYDLDRREIIREVGGDAFNYGLIIGHEIDRVAPAGTGDIHVTFLDDGIQYFLGAFQFMQNAYQRRKYRRGTSFQSWKYSDKRSPVSSLLFVDAERIRRSRFIQQHWSCV